MRITRLRIENFRSIKQLDIERGDTIVVTFKTACQHQECFGGPLEGANHC